MQIYRRYISDMFSSESLFLFLEIISKSDRTWTSHWYVETVQVYIKGRGCAWTDTGFWKGGGGGGGSG